MFDIEACACAQRVVRPVTLIIKNREGAVLSTLAVGQGKKYMWHTRNKMFADVPSPWYSFVAISYHWCWIVLWWTMFKEAARSLLPRPAGLVFSPYRLGKRGIFNIHYTANTFQIWKMLQANFIEPTNTQYARTFTSKNIHKEFTVAVHNSHHFKKLNGTN